MKKYLLNFFLCFMLISATNSVWAAGNSRSSPAYDALNYTNTDKDDSSDNGAHPSYKDAKAISKKEGNFAQVKRGVKK